MARTPKKLASGEISSTALITIYTAPTGSNTTISVLGFCNTGSTATTIDIYENDGSTDFLSDTITLPGGSGKRATYYGLQRSVVNAGDAIKVQSSTTMTFNYFLHGSEVTV